MWSLFFTLVVCLAWGGGGARSYLRNLWGGWYLGIGTAGFLAEREGSRGVLMSGCCSCSSSSRVAASGIVGRAFTLLYSRLVFFRMADGLMGLMVVGGSCLFNTGPGQIVGFRSVLPCHVISAGCSQVLKL